MRLLGGGQFLDSALAFSFYTSALGERRVLRNTALSSLLASMARVCDSTPHELLKRFYLQSYHSQIVRRLISVQEFPGAPGVCPAGQL